MSKWKQAVLLFCLGSFWLSTCGKDEAETVTVTELIAIEETTATEEEAEGRINIEEMEIDYGGYSDVLYSTIENWIVMDENMYILYSDGELEKIEKMQVEVPMLEEIEAFGITSRIK